MSYLSVEQAAPYEALDADLVIDQYADMGPLGGILSGLEKCGADALLVVPCDMIPFPGDMALWMAEQYRKTGRPVIPCVKGRILSFPGIYTKKNVADIKADGRSEGLPYKEGMGDVKDSLREGACGGSWLEDRQTLILRRIIAFLPARRLISLWRRL